MREIFIVFKDDRSRSNEIGTGGECNSDFLNADLSPTTSSSSSPAGGGGGGGGGTNSSKNGASGGSGIVIVRYEVIEIVFTFTNPVPTHLSTVYGTSHTLQLTTTLSGDEPNYIYDAVFYNASNDVQIGSTVSGLDSGQAAPTTMQTPSGIDYSWYIIATSSGENGTSSTYTFTNKFLCSGTTEINKCFDC